MKNILNNLWINLNPTQVKIRNREIMLISFIIITTIIISNFYVIDYNWWSKFFISF